ncbi:hypothetical protein STSP2_01224 [Anaerohalosphaera lusitana]|uniref:Laminin G domain protein n=1 Tax=Anaerohalosphaera lusitana TaxID=1936003 RepID=A0A1U9NJG6_9BACT|nr:LamG domain-containing protein [Anaerohalosphaera lusitana]AQT68069.1 hypothetical protein STSP2_01224 [Anaerohalosphaera lusitana]
MFNCKVFVKTFVLVLFMAFGGYATGAAPETLTQQVNHNGGTLTLRMTKETVRGPQFNVKVQNASGAYGDYTAGEVRTYMGTVDEDPSALVAGVLSDNGQLKTKIYFDRGHTLFTEGAAVTGHRGSGIPAYSLPTMATLGAGRVGGDMYRFNIGIDVAYWFYNRHNDVGKCLEMVEFAACQLKAMYTQNALLMPALSLVVIRTSAEACPYEGVFGNTQLGVMKNQWNNDHYANLEGYEAAALGVGQLGGGVAWVGQLYPSDARYCFNGISGDGNFDILARHELGHLWGGLDNQAGRPEGSTIMCGNYYGRFSGPVLERIINNRNKYQNAHVNIGKYTNIQIPPYAALDVMAEGIREGNSWRFDVMANDHDANAEAMSIYNYDSSSNLGGTVTLSQGTGPDGRDELLYFAPIGKTGTDSFHYTIEDSSGSRATGVVVAKIVAGEKIHAYWPLDEMTGTTAQDIAYNANGTLNGGLDFANDSVTGKYDSALNFDGVDDYIALGTDPALSGTFGFSISAWVKTTASGVIIQQRDGSVGGYNGQYIVRVNSDGTAGFVVYNDGYQLNFASTQKVNDGNWHHIVAVRQGNDGYIYVDAGAPATDSGPVKSLNANLAVSIGVDIRDSVGYFDGVIDDVKIYNYPITAQRITDIYTGDIRSDLLSPKDGSAGVTKRILEWLHVPNADSYDVYLGTSYTAVANATPGSAEYQGNTNSTIYDASFILDGSTEYFWRIDPVNAGGALPGNVWDFTTDSTVEPYREVCHWTFDGTLADATGNGYDGTASKSPVYVAGVSGQALNADEITVEHVLAQQETWQEFTVTVWAKSDTHTQMPYAAVFNNNSDGNDFQIDCGEDTYRYYAYGLVDMAAISMNDWTMLTAACDADSVKLYTNGELVAQSSNRGVDFGRFAVGVNRGGTNFFDGAIDDLRIFNYARSAEEIATDYYAITGEAICLERPSMDIAGPNGKPDCKVDLHDFASFAAEWMDCGLSPQEVCPQ